MHLTFLCKLNARSKVFSIFVNDSRFHYIMISSHRSFSHLWLDLTIRLSWILCCCPSRLLYLYTILYSWSLGGRTRWIYIRNSVFDIRTYWHHIFNIIYLAWVSKHLFFLIISRDQMWKILSIKNSFSNSWFP